MLPRRMAWGLIEDGHLEAAWLSTASHDSELRSCGQLLVYTQERVYW